MSQSCFLDELNAADKLLVDLILSADRLCSGRNPVQTKGLKSQDAKNFMNPKVKFIFRYCLLK